MSSYTPLLLLVALFTATHSFVSNSQPVRFALELEAMNSRRSFLTSAGASLLVLPQVASATEYRQGIEVTAFNGLIFNYKGGDFNGLDASTLNEPSVPYLEFCERLKAGEVEFVEFMAPDGDAAYVTFKKKDDETNKTGPIRIGEGYPIEQHDGYSSPLFVVRTVKNFGVPYKFTVPGLNKYSSS